MEKFKEEKLLNVLKEAIEEERKAQIKYMKGMDLSTDPEVREMFRQLIKDEHQHEAILLKRYSEIKKTSRFED